MSDKTETRSAWRRRLIILVASLCGLVLSASVTYLVLQHIDNRRINEQTSELIELASPQEIADSADTVIIGEDSEPTNNPYWDYIKMDLIDVDFTELKQRNNQTVGWIQVGGTNINYPFVQTTDNSYYLTHDFDNNYNAAGWVYMDYRNSKTSGNKNTIIYGHSRLDQTMFGSLKNILTNGWLDNESNHVIRMSTENENTLWQVFSVYHIPTTSDYLQVDFSSSDQYQGFLDMLKDRSVHNFDTNVTSSDRILTLSTCYGYTDRVVLHAKLIKVDAN